MKEHQRFVDQANLEANASNGHPYYAQEGLATLINGRVMLSHQKRIQVIYLHEVHCLPQRRIARQLNLPLSNTHLVVRDFETEARTNKCVTILEKAKLLECRNEYQSIVSQRKQLLQMKRAES